MTKGTKTIFRNVFVRELGEIRVPGMSSWYRSLQAHGAQFHYVSNSPIELWPVLRTFLKLAGFPNGSCSLKEYGGASSALAKLWEEPGQRKKANVETILKEFPAARCVVSTANHSKWRTVLISIDGARAQVHPRWRFRRARPRAVRRPRTPIPFQHPRDLHPRRDDTVRSDRGKPGQSAPTEEASDPRRRAWRDRRRTASSERGPSR